MTKRPLRAAAAAAVGTLDQTQTDTCGEMIDIIGPPIGVIPPHAVAQTFIAGLSGTLDEVHLFAGSNGFSDTEPIIVEVRDTVGGAPGSTVLASTTIAAVDVTATGDWLAASFANPAIVLSGIRYAIVVHAPGRTVYVWYCGAPTADTSGALWETFAYPPLSGWGLAIEGQAAFRTYVTTVARPAPGSPTASSGTVAPSRITASASVFGAADGQKLRLAR